MKHFYSVDSFFFEVDNEILRRAKKIVQEHELTRFISNMISDNPTTRPSIRQVEEFLDLQRFMFTDFVDKITTKDLGINNDLEVTESCISNDVKRRAETFAHCPFSNVNLMSSINHVTSYEELSKAGYNFA